MLKSLGVAFFFLLLISPATGQNHATKSEPGQEHRNSGRSPVEVVRVFYTYVTTYRPLGIPMGHAKNALWPLMSKRGSTVKAECRDGVRRTVSYYRFNTDWSIRMLKIASCSLDRKRAKSLGTLESSGFRGFLSIRG